MLSEGGVCDEPPEDDPPEDDPPEDDPEPDPLPLPEDEPPVVSDGCCVDGASVSGWACVLLPALA